MVGISLTIPSSTVVTLGVCLIWTECPISQTAKEFWEWSGMAAKFKYSPANIYYIYISTWSGNYVNLQLVTDGFSLCLDLGGLNQRHHRWSIRGLSSNMAGKSPANEAFMGNTLINGRLASQFWLNSWTELNCWFGFMQKWVNPMGFDSSSQGDLGYSQPPNI